MITTKDVAVLIPTYNEAQNIGQTIDQVFAVDKNLSVMVLDDASPDGTGRVVQEKMRQYPNLQLVERTADKGFAQSYIDGFSRVQAACKHTAIITMDADFSHEPKEIPHLITLLNKGADVVVGSRYASGQSFPHISLWRRILSRIANRYVQTILHIPVTDCTSGFIALRVDFLPRFDLKRIRTDGYGFLFGLKHEAAQNKATIAEHPVRWPDRHQGKSKMTFKRIVESALLPWKIRYASSATASAPITRN